MADLIAYFSRRYENYVNGTIRNLDVGNTEIAAGIVQTFTGADLFKIEPLQEYSRNYNECIAQAQADQRRGARPELKEYPKSLDQYDRIYLGYPNYWSTMPMAVFTFLEHFDFTGKIILPFCTHEVGGMGSSEQDIKRICPEAEVRNGLAIFGGSAEHSKEDIRTWIQQNRERQGGR